MGCGKTTVGRMLAQATGRNFIDTDQLIEKQTGMSIFELITNKGEDYFRKVEKDTILSLSPKDSSIVATGGGAVMDDDVFLFLKNIGKIIYLKASPVVLFMRTANVDNRPLLKGGNRLDIIQNLLKRRETRYLASDIVIETDNITPNEIVENIIKKIRI